MATFQTPHLPPYWVALSRICMPSARHVSHLCGLWGSLNFVLASPFLERLCGDTLVMSMVCRYRVVLNAGVSWGFLFLRLNGNTYLVLIVSFCAVSTTIVRRENQRCLRKVVPGKGIFNSSLWKLWVFCLPCVESAI